MHRVAKRLLVGLTASLGVLVLLEGALRVAAVWQARQVVARLADEAGGNRPVVAFVGDSNIYGIYVDVAQTLPKVVERLSREGGAQGIHAVNRGVPGSPSWVVLEQLKRALDYRPVAIVARCGINNYSAAPPGEGLGIFEGLRLVKALRNLYVNWQWRDAKPFDVPSGIDANFIEKAGKMNERSEMVFHVAPRDGSQAPVEVIWSGNHPFGEFAPRMKSDFLEMARLAHAAGARLILTTYLAGDSSGFEPITAMQRGLAGQEGIVLADCSKLVEQAVQASRAVKGAAPAARQVPPGLGPGLFLTADRHPTAIGYEMEARVVVNALVEAGVLPKGPPLDPLAPIETLDVGMPSVRRLEPNGFAFEVVGKPFDRFALLIGKPGTSVVEDLTVPFDVRPIDAVAGPRMRTGMSGVADAKGKARLEIPAQVLTKLRGDFLVACMVHRGGRGPSSQRILTDTLAVRIGD